MRGAGGLGRGLLDAGGEVSAGCARDSQPPPAWERNNLHARFALSDIRAPCPESIAPPSPAVRHSELLLGESAPCQPFSARRKRIGSRDAAVLLGDFDRSLVAIRPIWVLIETVPGIPRVPGTSTIRRFFRLLVRDCRRRNAAEFSGIVAGSCHARRETASRRCLLSTTDPLGNRPGP